MRLAIGIAVAGLISACSVNRASVAVECNADQTCDDPMRQCIEGWCVPPQMPDASDVPDGTFDAEIPCPTECTSCTGSLCTIDCALTDCTGEVTCPPDRNCRIQCGQDDCNVGVDCSAALSCDLECRDESCRAPVTCPADGRCDVNCVDNPSCDGMTLDCSNSCACKTTCMHPQSCAGAGFSCPFVNCQAGVDDPCNDDDPVETCDMCQ